LERRDPRGKLLVLVPGARRHLFNGLEFLAADDVHAGHHPLHLRAGESLSLPPRAVGKARRVGHEARKIVEETAVGLRHGSAPMAAPAIDDAGLSAYVARGR